MRPFRGAGAVTAVAGATATLVVHMTSPSSAAGSEQQPLRTVAEHARTRSVLLSGPQAQRQTARDRKWSLPPGNVASQRHLAGRTVPGGHRLAHVWPRA